MLLSESKTSNVLERSSGKNKEVRSEGTERRTTYTTRPKRDVQRKPKNGSMGCQNARLGNMEFEYISRNSTVMEVGVCLFVRTRGDNWHVVSGSVIVGLNTRPHIDMEKIGRAHV